MLTISHTVAEQLRALRLVPSGGLTVLDLGPGQFESYASPASVDREPSILLIGAGAHKRNELAATLLGQIEVVRANYRVVSISVSETTIDILRQTFPEERLDVLDAVSPDQLADRYRTASHYVALGVSEGFGFPYIEAAYFGCDVVAPRQAVTIELLGDDANHLPTSSPDAAALDLALRAWDRERVVRLRQRATARSWDRAAGQIGEIVSRLFT